MHYLDKQLMTANVILFYYHLQNKLALTRKSFYLILTVGGNTIVGKLQLQKAEALIQMSVTGCVIK